MRYEIEPSYSLLLDTERVEDTVSISWKARRRRYQNRVHWWLQRFLRL